jgi:hypothetical protein
MITLPKKKKPVKKIEKVRCEFYLPKPLAMKIKKLAKAAKLSYSQYISDFVKSI